MESGSESNTRLVKVYIGTPEGILKVRTFRRKGIITDKWNQALINSVQGTPWEPVPGREGAEVASRVQLPRVPAEIPPMINVPKEEIKSRRPRI